MPAPAALTLRHWRMVMAALVNRRDFLYRSAALAAGAGLAVAGRPRAEEKKNQIFPISLAQWSLHNALFKKKMDNLDFAAAAKKDYGIGAVEYVNQFFKDK